MGQRWSCIEGVPSIPRLTYDLSPIIEKSVPIIWLIGPPGSGRRTQGELIQNNLGFDNIRVTQLLREEAARDTERGKVIADAIKNRLKKIPDTLVVDLIKEAMLKTADSSKGYLINNFPKSPKQAEIFLKEIKDVDVILYLYCDSKELVDRVQQKINGRLTNETIRRKIERCIKDIKDCLYKISYKMQKVNTSGSTEETYDKIVSVISNTIHFKSQAVVSETGYAQNLSAE